MISHVCSYERSPKYSTHGYIARVFPTLLGSSGQLSCPGRRQHSNVLAVQVLLRLLQ